MAAQRHHHHGACHYHGHHQQQQQAQPCGQKCREAACCPAGEPGPCPPVPPPVAPKRRAPSPSSSDSDAPSHSYSSLSSSSDDDDPHPPGRRRRLPSSSPPPPPPPAIPRRSTPRSHSYIHVCVILSRKDGSVLADGFNSEVSVREATPRRGFSMHAEEMALDKLLRLPRSETGKRLRCGVDVVSLRVSRAMVVGMSRPCLRCAGRLQSQAAMVRRVFWWEAGKEDAGGGSVVQARVEELQGHAEHSTGDFFVKRGRSKNYTCPAVQQYRPPQAQGKFGYYRARYG